MSASRVFESNLAGSESESPSSCEEGGEEGSCWAREPLLLVAAEVEVKVLFMEGFCGRFSSSFSFLGGFFVGGGGGLVWHVWGLAHGDEDVLRGLGRGG